MASCKGRNEHMALWSRRQTHWDGTQGLALTEIKRNIGGVLESPVGQGEEFIFWRNEDSLKALKQVAGGMELRSRGRTALSLKVHALT